MKNKRTLLLVGILISMFFSIEKVNAIVGPLEQADSIVFENNGQIHTISERKISCLEGKEIYFETFDLKGNFYFEVDGEIIKITKDNECVTVTAEDKININEFDRYRNELEITEEGKVVINVYDRYEEAYYETTDTEFVNGKTYYTFDENNVEMIEFTETVFEENVTYYESGYVVMIKNSTKEESLTYYKRYTTYVPNGKLIFKSVQEYNEEDSPNYYIVNNNVTKPEKTIELNQETFKEILNNENIDYLDVFNLGEYYYIYVYFINNDTHIYDIDGNLLATNKQIFPLGNDLYATTNMDDYKLAIYYKDTKLVDIDKYHALANTYYSDHYNLGMALNFNENDEEYYLILHRIYDIVSGENQKFIDKDLEFTFSGELELFHRILIDDKEIEEENYTKENGSTIITLKNEYLKTLKNGTHKLKIEYKDGGYVETTFEVDPIKDNINIPNTNDNLYNYIILGTLSLILIGMSLTYLKKRNKKLA